MVFLLFKVHKSHGFNYLLLLYAYDFLNHFRHELNQEAPAGLQVYTGFYDSPDLEKEDGHNITKYFISPAVKLDVSFIDGSNLGICLNACAIVKNSLQSNSKPEHWLLFVHEVTLNTPEVSTYGTASEGQSKEVTLSKEEPIEVAGGVNQYIVFIGIMPSAKYAIELTLEAREKQKAAQ